MTIAGTTNTIRLAGFPSGYPAEQEANVKIRFVDTALEVMSDYDIPLLTRLGGPGQFTTRNTTHEWILYDTWTDRFDLGAQLAQAGTTLTMDGTKAHRVPPGTILKIEDELIRVTAMASTSTLTVTRGFAGTTDVLHANATLVRMVGFAEPEGEDIVLRGSALRAVPFNYHSIYKTGSSESFAQQESQVYTRTGPTMNEMMADNIAQYAVLLEGLAVEGERHEGVASTDPPMMGGIRFYCTTANGATVVDAGGSKLSRAHFNTAFDGSYDAVGAVKQAKMILCGRGVKRVLYEEYVQDIERTTQGAARANENFSRIETEYGSFEVLGPFKRIPEGEVWGINPALMKVGQYGSLGRLHEVMIPTSGDYTSRGLYAMNTAQLKGIPGLFRIHNFTLT